MPDPAPESTPGGSGPASAAASLQPQSFRGQPCIHLQLPCGDSALIALHGAQVLSWVAGGRERLYLSPQAVFDGQAAIRGGIPLCFPQFNQRGPLMKHGFARHLPWKAVADAPPGQAVLRLTDDDRTRGWWPHGFVASLTVALSPGSLHVALSVHNTGADAWDFTTALHSYLRVDDIGQVQVEGLDGCARWDAVTDTHSVQHGALRFAGEYDSVFQAKASAPLQLQDGTHTLTLEQSASCSNHVVWNPGAGLCAQLSDMPADGYTHMLCLETAQIDTPVHLEPGAGWSGWQHLRAGSALSGP